MTYVLARITEEQAKKLGIVHFIPLGDMSDAAPATTTATDSNDLVMPTPDDLEDMEATDLIALLTETLSIEESDLPTKQSPEILKAACLCLAHFIDDASVKTGLPGLRFLAEVYGIDTKQSAEKLHDAVASAIKSSIVGEGTATADDSVIEDAGEAKEGETEEVETEEGETEEGYTEEEVNAMSLAELHALIDENGLEIKKTKNLAAMRKAIIEVLQEDAEPEAEEGEAEETEEVKPEWATALDEYIGETVLDAAAAMVADLDAAGKKTLNSTIKDFTKRVKDNKECWTDEDAVIADAVLEAMSCTTEETRHLYALALFTDDEGEIHEAGEPFFRNESLVCDGMEIVSTSERVSLTEECGDNNPIGTEFQNEDGGEATVCYAPLSQKYLVYFAEEGAVAEAEKVTPKATPKKPLRKPLKK